MLKGTSSDNSLLTCLDNVFDSSCSRSTLPSLGWDENPCQSFPFILPLESVVYALII